MTALEIRLLAYLGAGIAYTALIVWATVTLTNHHWERVTAADRLAQAAQVQAQQQKTIDDLKAQQAATAAAEQKYAELKANTAGLSDQLSRSVSEYSALRRGLVSATSSTAALADAARAGAQRDSELAGLVRQATEACQGDAAQLTALQIWARGTAAETTR
jgi:septal ring factor EnvC (AmiA/AmiB activator)